MITDKIWLGCHIAVSQTFHGLKPCNLSSFLLTQLFDTVIIPSNDSTWNKRYSLSVNWHVAQESFHPQKIHQLPCREARHDTSTLGTSPLKPSKRTSPQCQRISPWQEPTRLKLPKEIKSATELAWHDFKNWPFPVNHGRQINFAEFQTKVKSVEHPRVKHKD